MPPATPEALTDIDDIAKVPVGLEKRFAEGEQVPWKGIWFEIEAVSPDRILLKPVGETWKHHKQRTGRV